MERGRQTGGHFTMAVRFGSGTFFYLSGWGFGGRERRVVKPRSETNVEMWDVWLGMSVCVCMYVRSCVLYMYNTYVTQDKRTAPPRRAERGKRGRRRRFNVFFPLLFFPCAQKCRWPPLPAQPNSPIPPSPIISVEKRMANIL